MHPAGAPEAETWVTARLELLLRGRSQHVAAGIAQPEERIEACCATWARYGRFIREEGIGFP